MAGDGAASVSRTCELFLCVDAITFNNAPKAQFFFEGAIFIYEAVA